MHAALGQSYANKTSEPKQTALYLLDSITTIQQIKGNPIDPHCHDGKAADELSIASVTRGIGDLNLRTCLVNIQMRVEDWLALFLFAALLIS